jgi:large subunit ribosomal protein L5
MSETAAATKSEGRYVPRLRIGYREQIVGQMMERYGYKNPMAVPRLHKIVINMGVGEANQNIKLLDAAA